MYRLLLSVILIAVLVGCVSQPVAPAREALPATATGEPTAVVAESTPTAVPPTVTTVLPTPTAPIAGQGLGVSRQNAMRFYQLLQFNFTGEGDKTTGTVSDGLAMVEFVGPPENVTTGSLVIDVPKPPTQSQSARTATYLGAMLTVLTADWKDSATWLSTSLNKTGESRTVHGNAEIVLMVTPKADKTEVRLSVRGR